MEEERMRKRREDARVSWAVKRIAWVQAEEFKEAHEWLAELGEAKANEFHRVRKRKQEDPEAWRLAKVWRRVLPCFIATPVLAHTHI